MALRKSTYFATCRKCNTFLSTFGSQSMPLDTTSIKTNIKCATPHRLSIYCKLTKQSKFPERIGFGIVQGKWIGIGGQLYTYVTSHLQFALHFSNFEFTFQSSVQQKHTLHFKENGSKKMSPKRERTLLRVVNAMFCIKF